MKTKLLFVLLIFLSAIFGSCKSTAGFISHSINTEVQLSQANYKVIGSVTGEATAKSVFGIGINQADLFNQARQDMIKKADLTGKSRAIINVTTDMKTRHGLFSVSKTVYISGEVIEFIK